MRKNLYLCIVLVGFMGLAACNTSPKADSKSQDTKEEAVIPKFLPFQTLNLDDLQAFQNPDPNWKIVGEAYALYEQKHSLISEPGKGVLAFVAEGNQKPTAISTKMEHGDLELMLEFLCTKESSAQILFQGKYGLQIADSWGKSEAGVILTGAIAPQQAGQNAQKPTVNAGYAPGLWQKLHAFFKAPQFDAQGKKTQNARLEYVYLNGMMIHRNTDLPAPSKDALSQEETAMGALTFLDEIGPVAFRNIQYKTYSSDSLSLNNLTCKAYYGKWDYIPNFDTLKPAKEEKNLSFFKDFDEVSGQSDHYALRYEGELIVPKTGEYLFETMIDDGGDLIIDGKTIIHNQGEPGFGAERAIVQLSAGKHPLVITYYEEVWASTLAIYYEGPGIARRTLASIDIEALYGENQNTEPLIISPEKKHEVMRSFVNYKDQKRTHAISVGSPLGVHYSYDLLEGSLLKAWKGGFANVAEMWQDRGEPQLLKPLNAVIEPEAGIPFAILENENSPWPTEKPAGFRYKGYKIAKDEHPIFLYELTDISIEDDFLASEAQQLQRTLRFKASKPLTGHWLKLAQAKEIKILSNGWYSIDQHYYLKLLDQTSGKEKLRKVGDKQELIIPFLESKASSEVKMAFLW